MGKQSAEYKNKFMAESYDQLRIFVRKGEKEIIKNFASSRGQSINSFVTGLIRREMEDDNHADQ